MKKMMLFVLSGLLICSMAFAGVVNGSINNVFTTEKTGNTGTTVVSRTFPIASVRSTTNGYWVKVHKGDTASTINEAISVMGSWDDVLADFATTSTISFATNDTATAGTLTLPSMKYVKFKATSVSGQYDSASTGSTLTMYLFTQE